MTGSPAIAAPNSVEIVDFEFARSRLTVAPGTEARWTNRDQAVHTVKDQSELGAVESEQLSRCESFSITYREPGTYPCICGIHNYMTGSVVVEASAVIGG